MRYGHSVTYYYGAVAKLASESFSKSFICECAGTVLAPETMRVDKINSIHVLVQATFEWGRQTTHRQTN